MKKLLSGLLILGSVSVFAQKAESFKSIASNKVMQQRLAQEINFLKKVPTSFKNLESYANSVFNRCNRKAEKSESKVLLENCTEKYNEMIKIGDLQTVVDLQIAELSEMQSANNIVFFITKGLLENIDEAERGYYKGETIFLTLLTPIAVVADIVLLPITFIASAITGF